MLGACGACIVLFVRGVEYGVGIQICVSVLSGRLIHADRFEAAGECLVEEVFHYGPSFQLDHLPIIEFFYREDVCLS